MFKEENRRKKKKKKKKKKKRHSSSSDSSSSSSSSSESEEEDQVRPIPPAKNAGQDLPVFAPDKVSPLTNLTAMPNNPPGIFAGDPPVK